jgi:uncharacterized surface protein with fasciclin (FAS1) repeats
MRPTVLVLLLAALALPAGAQDGAVSGGVRGGETDRDDRAIGLDGEGEGPVDIEGDVVETAHAAEDVDTFVAGIAALDLVDRLRSEEGPFTLLAPTDAAFLDLPRETLEGLLLEENDDRLGPIVRNHVVRGRLDAEALAGADTVETLSGEDHDLAVEDGALVVGGARVVARDLEAANGVVHVIDGVLEP